MSHSNFDNRWASLGAGFIVSDRLDRLSNEISAKLDEVNQHADDQAWKENRLQRLKQWVFEINLDIQENNNQNPLNRYIEGIRLNSIVNSCGIEVSEFPSFTDKEYVQKTLNELAAFTRSSVESTTVEERALIDEFIVCNKKTAELKEQHERRQELEEAAKLMSQNAKEEKTKQTVTAIFGSIIMLMLLGGFIANINSDTADSGETTIWCINGVIVTLIIWAIVDHKLVNSKLIKESNNAIHEELNLLDIKSEMSARESFDLYNQSKDRLEFLEQQLNEKTGKTLDCIKSDYKQARALHSSQAIAHSTSQVINTSSDGHR